MDSMSMDNDWLDSNSFQTESTIFSDIQLPTIVAVDIPAIIINRDRYLYLQTILGPHRFEYFSLAFVKEVCDGFKTSNSRMIPIFMKLAKWLSEAQAKKTQLGRNTITVRYMKLYEQDPEAFVSKYKQLVHKLMEEGFQPPSTVCDQFYQKETTFTSIIDYI